MLRLNQSSKLMKLFLPILKWIGISLASLIILIVLAGVSFRVFGPDPHQPPGQLVEVGDNTLHIRCAGERSSAPTVVIEGGAGLPTEFYHWLDEGIRDSLRVVRYDRAGLGHSAECMTPRDPETVARELQLLLTEAGESPPYLMMGHSIGGPYIRVFAQLFPDEVDAMFFLDATHPDHVERHNAPKESSLLYKAYLVSIGAEAVLADLGILSLFDELFGTPYFGEGLPPENNSRIKDFLKDGKSFRTFKQEMKQYYSTLSRSAEADHFGAMPIRVFTASSIHSRTRPETESEKQYLEYADLSSNGEHIQVKGNHVTIFSKQENAEIICKEVLQVVRDLER